MTRLPKDQTAETRTMVEPLPAQPRASGQKRAAETRRRILAATVSSLAHRGLQETSTLQIQADAEVSRGRLLHHFPHKQKLLMATFKYLAAERLHSLREAPLSSTGEERARQAVDAIWSTYDGDLFWAALELWMGARHDAALAHVLATEERHLIRVFRDMCDQLLGTEFTSHPSYLDVREILLTSMRGVAITHAFESRPMKQEPYIEVWYRLAIGLLQP
jgi:AcrR family transcriptional regulator